MHTRASNSELVEPLPEPEHTLNRRLRRRHRRVPFDQRNNPPQHPRIVYPSILDINYFCHFLDILRNYDLMDDEPMWAADCVVSPTPGLAITIPETANEFAIQALFDQLHGEIRAFSQHENESLTDAWLRMKEMLRNCHGHNISNDNPDDQQNNSKNPINFDSDDEDDEPTPQPKTQPTKPPQGQCFIDSIRGNCSTIDQSRIGAWSNCYSKDNDENLVDDNIVLLSSSRINVPLVDVLAGMPNYGKILKELLSNKHKIEQISAAFLSDESSATIQNKVPPKLGHPGSFLILCNFNKTFVCNALSDLGASINLMPYSLYAKLSLETLKPTKMSVILADQSFQYPIGIAENMLIKVGKFTFPADFVILEMEEESKVPLILGRPFLHTADAVIRVKQKQLNLGVGTERMIFNIDSAIKHSYSNNDTCFNIDVIDEILEEDFDALLDEGSKILHSIEGTILKEEIFFEFNKFIAMATNENYNYESDEEELKFKKITINTDYKIKTSLEEPPTDLELKPLPDNLEYVFLEEPSFLPVIISSQLSAQNKSKLISVLKKHKEAFAWKMTDIPAQDLPTNDARVVVTFLKKLYCRFKMPKALISDRVPVLASASFSAKLLKYLSKEVKVERLSPVPSTTPLVVVHNDIPNIALDVVIDGITVLVHIIPLIATLVAYLSLGTSSPIVSLFLLTGSLVLLAPLPTRPPVPPPRGAAVDRLALHVVILGGIIYTRVNMGNVR
ncbi:reverse transcriptase domain-containing protein [Tanacetum coccineum]